MPATSQSRFKSGYVAIIGVPNVGKSTLLNKLLDVKVSSVSRKPQTTRHQIRGILSADDYQIVFLDTPGLLQPRYKLHEAMLQAVQRSIVDADVVLFMVPAAAPADTFERAQLSDLAARKKTIVLVLNKIDKTQKQNLLPIMDFYRRTFDLQSIIPISALRGDGLDNLKAELVAALPAGPPLYDRQQLVDHPERFVVAEIVREKIFERYGDEIPYATTVKIDEFRENAGRKDFVRAVIFVEHSSQKGILIGKDGETLRRLGRAARTEIETLLERPIYLELWVKVKEKWRKDEQMLKELGYF
jgi:GTP-binding protein Era